MSDQVPSVDFDTAIGQISSDVLGSELVITIVSDYQNIPSPKKDGKMISAPVTSVFKIEILKTTKEYLVDFLRKVNEFTPILRIQYSRIITITPPAEVQAFLDLMKEPCAGCSGSCKNKGKGCGKCA